MAAASAVPAAEQKSVGSFKARQRIAGLKVCEWPFVGAESSGQGGAEQ